ncbi:MAG: hypothetical protein LBB62_09235 [Proteiniphilum sp.]|jgi:uncharacterized membrane protein YczE|nr:hypothetical protein [Proteiniphilum sp.]
MFLYREGLRIARLAGGLFLFALGTVMTIQANLGLSPWNVFHQGVSFRLGISFGTANIAVAAALVAFIVLVGEHVGFGTLCDMVLVGAFADILIFADCIPEMGFFFSGLLMMTGGLFVMAVASFFYMGAGYGAGPRDSLMVVMARRTGRPVGLCRALIEGAAALCGWALGGSAGIGTIIAAFGIGITIQIVFALLRFNVRTVRQESFFESWARLKARSTYYWNGNPDCFHLSTNFSGDKCISSQKGCISDKK